MSIKNCFDTAVRHGVLSFDEGERFKARFDAISAHTLDTAEARARLQAEVEAEAAHRERAALLTQIRLTAAIEALDGYRNMKGERDRLEAFVAMHENFGSRGSFIQDVEGRRETIAREHQGIMKRAMHEFRRGAIVGDLRRTSSMVGNAKVQARMDNVVRELAGTATGDATAAAMAKAWEQASESLRIRFNAAGGAVPKLKGWMMPQGHSVDALIQMKQTPWVEHMMRDGVLDRDRMVHPLTGERLSDDDLRASLVVAWERIVTDGWSDKDVTAVAGKGAVYTQHMDHRFLHFKDADAWLAYQKRFGEGDVFSAMMGHIGVMSRDIAAMEVFGPNPNRLREYMKNLLRSEAARQTLDPASPNYTVVKDGMEGRKLADHVRSRIAKADAMWASMRGVEPANVAIAEVMQSVRNYITATSLGGAWLSSLNDPAMGQDTRLRLGMGFAKANFGRLMIASLRELITHGSREDAVDAMLGLDSAMNIVRRRAREVKGIDHKFWSGWIADRTVSIGLLSPWTQGGKHLVGLDIMRHVGSQVGNDFDGVHPALRRAFERHGIDAAGWDRMRAASLHRGRLLRPNEVLAGAEREDGERYLQMILRETRHAVVESTVESRAMMGSAAPAGSLVGEMARSLGQFKGFGAAVVMLHAGRIAREVGAGDVRSGLGHGAALIITGTILGALAMSLKDIAAGRDPRKWLDEKTWFDPRFWGAAILQSGGLGIYGDLLFADVNRFGGGFESTVAGPLAGRTSDLIEATIVEGAKLVQGKKTTFGRSAMKVARRSVPLVGHFAISTAYQRVVMDALQRLADPDAARGFASEAAKRQRDYRQDYWWRPGQSSPSRLPDLSRPLATR